MQQYSVQNPPLFSYIANNHGNEDLLCLNHIYRFHHKNTPGFSARRKHHELNLYKDDHPRG